MKVVIKYLKKSKKNEEKPARKKIQRLERALVRGKL